MSREQGIATAKEFGALRQLFSAYLHEDFDLEYDSTEAAVIDYRQDVSELELAKTIDQLRQLLGQTLIEEELKDVLVWGLGSGYVPPDGRTADWLRGVLRTLEGA